MAIVPYVDFPTFVFVSVVIITIDIIGYKTAIGVFYIMAGVIGLYTTGAIFTQQSLIQQVTYTPAVGITTFTTNPVDPNIYAVVMAILTLMSFYFIYWERTFSG